MLSSVSHQIDLHCHTRYSDGSLTATDLLSHFKSFGVSTLAITDHDSVSVHYELESLENKEITIIPGVEISAGYGNKEIHVLGINIDVHCEQLKQFLSKQQAGRKARLIRYAEKLEKVGVVNAVDAVKQMCAESVTRTHLSQWLVETGVVPDARRAFKQYLGHKGKAYVSADWPELSNVVEVINQSGGVAVLAHPGKYPLSRKQLSLLINDFIECGGGGLEASYPNIDINLFHWLLEVAKTNDLYVSQGSDFHCPKWTWVKPGHFPKLPENAKGIWSLWS